MKKREKMEIRDEEETMGKWKKNIDGKRAKKKNQSQYLVQLA